MPVIRINLFSVYDVFADFDDDIQGVIVSAMIERALVDQGYNVGYNPPDVSVYLKNSFYDFKDTIASIVREHTIGFPTTHAAVIQRTPYYYDIVL